MYTIGQIAKKTGLSAHTIRYYEKEEILPEPRRKNGKDRYYSEGDMNFIEFVLSLKETGMSIENLKEIVRVGCLVQNQMNQSEQILLKRSEILTSHLLKLKEQEEQLKNIIHLTEAKLSTYQTMLTNQS